MRSLYTEIRESLCAATDSAQQKKKKKKVFPNFLTEMQPGAAQIGPASGQNKTMLIRLWGDSTGVTSLSCSIYTISSLISLDCFDGYLKGTMTPLGSFNCWSILPVSLFLSLPLDKGSRWEPGAQVLECWKNFEER